MIKTVEKHSLTESKIYIFVWKVPLYLVYNAKVEFSVKLY
jgi:hypothetical protein